jgi:hypothetical protein
MGTKRTVVCAQCEMAETRCECERYCVLCQSQSDIRLCMDGLYYCEACRTACEYLAVERY